MAKKNKQPTIKGAKQRAGLILSSLMRSIAEEVTESITLDGENKMISKAEALVRMTWKHALGFTEMRRSEEGANMIEVVHQPDRVYASMLYDRIEGRVAAVEPGKKEKRTVADKVGEQSKKRINSIAKDSVG